jgi:hypothetical protein
MEKGDGRPQGSPTAINAGLSTCRGQALGQLPIDNRTCRSRLAGDGVFKGAIASKPAPAKSGLHHAGSKADQKIAAFGSSYRDRVSL